MSEMLAHAYRNIRRWKADPVAFVREQFGVEPDIWQAEALMAFADKTRPKRRISLQACVGPGKSTVLAWIAWNFLMCYGEKGEHPKGAAVAITRDNLRDNLWPEIAKWQGRSQLLQHIFEWTSERISAKDHPETWFLSARSYSRKANAEDQGKTLSGLHSKFVLALLDESGEIPLPILKAAEQALSNCSFGRIMQAGNPTSSAGVLYYASKSDQWTVIRITGDPEDPRRATRIDIEWARDQIKEYGRENPWIMSQILGIFPPNDINNLIGPDEVREAMGRHPRTDEYDWSQKRLGIDAARFGGDPWVIFPRQGIASFTPIVMQSPKTEDVLGRILAKKMDWDSEVEFLDGSGGYAAGVADGLRAAKHRAIEVYGSGAPLDPRFFNKRSEMLWLCAQWTLKGGALPPIPTLIKEMTTPLYWHEKGKLRVEEKEQIKKRLGHSTNYFDALANTFALPDAPRGMIQREQAKRAHRPSAQVWDPFGEMGGSPEQDRGRTPL